MSGVALWSSVDSAVEFVGEELLGQPLTYSTTSWRTDDLTIQQHIAINTVVSVRVMQRYSILLGRPTCTRTRTRTRV